MTATGTAAQPWHAGESRCLAPCAWDGAIATALNTPAMIGGARR